ncbi:Terminase-like family protein [Devosia sp. YR412]|uniref:baseplate multidomain protein megatron n=1 Tax=Devosia sp. YR412 TaxID=1881030 RepID=UPI0008B090CB|nr:glycoside hydrolase TIM-barrel-like domain-containing protein [Devosia sp. YR412]SEP76747.1 Terminase-like family protein [Devosia sp. YR412]
MDSSTAVRNFGDPKTKTAEELETFYCNWDIWALDKQQPPEGDWTTWLLLGGRGSGKTRAGAEWVRKLAKQKIGPIALVGETMTEAIAIMVRGESGILNVHPDEERPVLKGQRLIWPNGVEAMVMSASDPDRFRGPQFAAAWCDELELLTAENAGAKGMSGPQEEVVGASFAVAFCEGTVSHFGRIRADGQLLDTEGLTLRFYRGTEDQLPDGLIEATQGFAPAYRGLCYLVVEQLPLNRFGNRIPHLSVELCRVVGDLEPNIRAVTVIPGATEFGYDPTPRVRLAGPGQTLGENTHVSATVSDWTLSMDELAALCPNLEHVALVVSWFGNDLRCGSCQIGPRVEAASRDVLDVDWRVMGLGRGEVPVVSYIGGGAAYGGTPSDASVLAAIADLKARGLSVTLYPLLMMDVPAGNGLPDPHGGAQQAAYPWRGRITCHPAPGLAGSPDKTAAAAAQVASFVPFYRQMVLHYAALAVTAGGVNTLVIGSEMVGLSTVRGAGNSFPFVSALVNLAADVRAVVGAATRLTYAADWSEYSGCQSAGEKFFHLDPLWASPNIDAVGIDNYMPLADWRDGQGHDDAALSASGYDLDYLKGNIAGGEGFDWYYASAADRAAQLRTPINDGAYSEPWVWRFKDIRNWWSQAHHDRPGGVRNAGATAWVPGSKPIWFSELGCGAVDKGANQPNIFGDPKSAESGRPHFSSELPDPLIQRQVLRAYQSFWRDPANNPPGMVDVSRIYHWTWDARPYPAFPALSEVWADGPNHRNGHWLTGRLGGMASDELAVAVAADHDVALTAEPATPFVGGYVLGSAGTAREALEPLLAATGLGLRNRVDGLHLGVARRVAALTLEAEALVAGEEPVLARKRGDPAEAPGRLALSYLDRERDYLTGTVTALVRADGLLAGESTALTLDASNARRAAERMLDQRSARREVLNLALPPGALALEPGDVIEIAGLAEGPFEIAEIRDGLARRVTAQTLPADVAQVTEVDRPVAGGSGVAVRALPLVAVAHLPPLPEDFGQSRLVVGAYAQPWPGSVQVVDDATGASVAELTRRGPLGSLAAPVGMGPLGVWDLGNVLEAEMLAGHLASGEALAVLGGSNRLALETDAGDWEVLGFAEAALVSPGRYRLSHLLRGLQGTGPAMGVASVGRRVMLLDGRVASLPLQAQWLGETRDFRLYAGARDVEGTSLSVATDAGPALPLPPVHLRAVRNGGDIALSWLRCSRADGDGWGVAESPLDHLPELYRLKIFNGVTPVRVLSPETSAATYTAAEQLADFGAPPASFVFTVAQVSPVLGVGHATQGEFHG